MRSVPFDVLQAVQALVYEACDAMNEESWSDYLRLCDEKGFRYRVMNYSPEIRREQLWADRDYKAMKAAFTLLPRHNSDHSKLTRHTVVQNVKYEPSSSIATVRSSLAIYRTQADGTMSYLESGQTSLYAIGSYVDEIRLTEGQPLLVDRLVRLDTRQLDVGTHKPF